MKRFCYRHPKFPRHGFVACLQMEKEGNFVVMHPLQTIYTSLPAFQFDLQLLMQTNPTFQEAIGDTVVMLPITLEKVWPLTKEYWETPEIPLTQETRQHMFTEAIENPEFYTLLATPLKYTKPYTLLSAVCPFMKNSSDEAIEQFMKTSNYPVPESASHAAIYSFEKPSSLLWAVEKTLQH